VHIFGFAEMPFMNQPAIHPDELHKTLLGILCGTERNEAFPNLCEHYG
jgi:hypothetical protein